MNRQIIKTLMASAVLMLVFFAASAGRAMNPPHNTTSCLFCHVSNRAYGPTLPNNVCLVCHKTGQSAGINPYTLQDMANPFGTFTSTLTGSKTQSSHNWSAPTNSPAAGSQEAQNPNMTLNSSLNNTVSCSRCHEIHGSYTSARYKPLLRMPNDSDQMCLDCHRPRNTTTAFGLNAAQQGTHPVSFTYTSASSRVKTKPSAYNNPPINTNPANPTAAMKLINGQVLCSTCHKVHFADSNSSTFHNHSSAILGRLSSSTGNLLRTSMYGATPTSTNICTNCHIKANHTSTAKNQNIQCADCHAGHVDYDPKDPTNTLGKNVYLIRRYMNYSSDAAGVAAPVKLSTYRRRTLFQYTSAAASNYKDANGTGVCQSCHAVPTGSAYPPEHGLTTATANICNTCHNHNTTTGSFAGSCTSCHGYPPRNNVAGGPTGYANDIAKGYNYSASGVFKNESTAGHMPHAGGAPYSFACNECHAGNSHDSNTFQDVFISKTGIIASNGGANPTYVTTGNGTCNTTYCHSNGAPRGGVIKYTSPQWALGRKTIVGTAGECVACHNGVITGFNNLSTNAHFKHVSNVVTTGKGYTCNLCHAATVSNNTTISSKPNHVNGIKDLSFSGSLATGTSMDASANCTSYCHSNGKGAAPVTVPNWTNRSTGACGTCHATSPVIGGATLISTNGHFAHFSSASNSYGPMLTQTSATSTSGCAACHTYTGDLAAAHVNGTVDVPSANCTTNCHKQVASINPVWTSGPVTCESCHTTTGGALSVINAITAPDKTSFRSIGHGQYSSSTLNRVGCISCHVRSDRHITKALGSTNRLGSTYTGINQNNLCSVCHNDPTKVVPVNRENMSTHVVDKNTPTPTPDLCSACHDVHGISGNLYSINNQIFAPTNPDIAGNGVNKSVVFTNTSSGFISKTRTGLCQVCHTKTNHYRNYTAASYTPSGGTAYNSVHPTKNCAACHDHKAVYAFKPNGNCDACHGYPPVASITGLDVHNNYTSARSEVYLGGGYINGGGAHSVTAHINPNARQSDAWTNCAICHSGGNLNPATHLMLTPAQQKNVVISVDPKYRFNNTLPITYSGPLNGTGTGAQTTGSCSNVSCHLQASPIWAP